VAEGIVLLHGFGGTRRSWDGVLAALAPPERTRVLALDLPGHAGAGGSATRRRLRGAVAGGPFWAGAADVLSRSPARFVLCGYSLGGRLALHVALAAPRRVARLVLVSASPGIEDAGERARRLAGDLRLARELERGGFERFIERWFSQPLFAGDPPDVSARARGDYARHDPGALARVLREMSAGAMAPLWDRLGELDMPVTALAGERDERYAAIALRVAARLPRGVARIVPGGHRLALENPAAVAAAIA
jgi:2-succinyl-6-hydroxy-2,4-cyclohexadiene-1-carboxylate synthase